MKRPTYPQLIFFCTMALAIVVTAIVIIMQGSRNSRPSNNSIIPPGVPNPNSPISPTPVSPGNGIIINPTANSLALMCSASTFKIMALEDGSKFYTKQIKIGNLRIQSSQIVSDMALLEASKWICQILLLMPNESQNLLLQSNQIIIIKNSMEKLAILPEYLILTEMNQSYLPGMIAVTIIGEDNLMCSESIPIQSRCEVISQFAGLTVLKSQYNQGDTKLKTSLEAAFKSSNNLHNFPTISSYWIAGVRSWFNCGPGLMKQELKTNDVQLGTLLTSFYKDIPQYSYTCPSLGY